VLGIDGNSGVAEFFGAGDGMVGRDVGPCASVSVELPDGSALHACGARRGAVGDVEEPVGGESGARGTIGGRFAGDFMPAGAAIS